MTVTFQFNRRLYSCHLVRMDNASVLKIKNEKGELLTVTKGCPTATKTKGKVVETIDLREKRHLNLFNLIRMAVISLEVDEKNSLLQEKDKSISNLEKQLHILQERNEIISQQNSHIPEELGRRLMILEEELEKTRKENQHLQTKMQQMAAEDDSSELSITEAVKSSLAKIWSLLHENDQRDLLLSARHFHRSESRGFGAMLGDYKEAGMRLSAVPERMVRVITKNFYGYLERTSNWDVINLLKENNKLGKETLRALPRLISDQWYTFDEKVLKKEAPTEQDYNNLMNYPTLLREDGVSKAPSSKACF